jgi:archaellum component FlaC
MFDVMERKEGSMEGRKKQSMEKCKKLEHLNNNVKCGINIFLLSLVSNKFVSVSVR